MDIEAISTQYRHAFDIVSILTRRSRTEYLNSIETLSMSRRYCFDIYVHTCRRLCGLVPFASFYVQNGSARYYTEAYKDCSYKARTTTHRKKKCFRTNALASTGLIEWDPIARRGRNLRRRAETRKNRSIIEHEPKPVRL